MKTTGKLIFIVFAFLALAASSCNASAATPDALPPEAQAAVNKGIIAAKLPDYILAIRFFEEARKIAPQAPVVYLNMGLAESRIPGRELRAIAWFGAYLAAYPDAANAAAVKEQIVVLDMRNQSNVSRLIKAVQDAASSEDVNLDHVAELWAQTGDITVALKTADLIRSDIYKDSAQRKIAKAQAQVGDIVGAQKTADLFQNASVKSSAQSYIAIAQTAIGDLKAAQKTILLIDEGWDRKFAVRDLAEALAKSGDIKTAISIAGNDGYAMGGIVKVQADAGDIVGAQSTLGLVVDSMAKEHAQEDSKSWALSAIAIAQANSGDIAGAQMTAGPLEKGYSPMSKVSLAIVKAQAKSGDVSGALKSMDRNVHVDTMCEGFIAIAEAQARAGDTTDAQKSLASARKSIKDFNNYPRLKANLEESISAVQAKIGSMGLGVPNTKTQPEALSGLQRTISNWISKLDDGNKYHDCPLNTEPFLDLAGYLKSLPQSNDPKKVFESLHETAQTIVKAQNVIHRMLKQEAKK